jgi:parvulin-like peptidyl-prolyl isomerase
MVLDKKERVRSEKFQKFIQRDLLIILLILFIAGFLFTYKSLFISAIVNGKPISRLALIKELETLAKDNVLNSLISKTLLYQEAEKRKIKVTQEDYDKAFKEVLGQFGNDQKKFEEYLTQQKVNMKDFNETIRFRLMLEKMFAKKIKITQKELDEFIEENKSYFPENITGNQIRKYAESQMRQMKLDEEVQKLVNDLRAKAKITILK